ncbi:nuclear receptor corepressor 2-like protein [Corchorus olitorius]|uniref:Nuclear receptor corepressor 2-like protein n=1 Tax=Corchorus olitorius TaxID=93759 RepID=A0A1R3ISS7_9ROSI|nr:nuclear receptor corepressor 2-like protein [Corchorus olitorius]
MNNASTRRVPETRAATVPFFAKEMEAQKGYSRELLLICDKANGDDDADRTTKCPVHTSATNNHAKIWRSDSTSLYHLSNWTLEEKDEVIPLSNPSVKKGLFKLVLKLQASHHQNDLKPPSFVTLGHRICRREMSIQ